MLFLVEMDFALEALSDDALSRLQQAEAVRAAQLAKEGTLRRVWRLPGQRANIGLWHATDGNELHVAISSLPLWSYARVRVTPLADHPNDPRLGI